MRHAISIDFGTTNTVIARWSEADGRSDLIYFDCAEEIQPASQLEDGKTFLIPSRITYDDHEMIKIGRQAKDPALHEKLRAEGRDGRSYHSMKREVLRHTAGDFWSKAASDFLREVLRQAALIAPPADTKLVLTFPVEAKNDYCRFLDATAREAGFTNSECIAEPIAAAMGIGRSIRPGDHLLVIDCGGGTTDVAWVCFEEVGATTERVRTIATSSYSSGGNDVDDWIRRHLLDQRTLPDDKDFRASLQRDARAIKEALGSQEIIQKNLFNAKTLESIPVQITRDNLKSILESHDFYHSVYGAVSRAIDYGVSRQLEKADMIRHVYFTGGSSQLPELVSEVTSRLKRRLKKDEITVTHHRPFTAVARGAAARANGFSLLDTSPREYYLMDHKRHDMPKNLHRIVIGTSKCPKEGVFQEEIELLPPYEGFFQVDVYEVPTSGETELRGGSLIDAEQNRDWINENFSIARTVKVNIGEKDRRFRLIFDLAPSRQLLMSVISLPDKRVIVAREPLFPVKGGVRA